MPAPFPRCAGANPVVTTPCGSARKVSDMHPGFFGWWKRGHSNEHGCADGDCHPGHGGGRGGWRGHEGHGPPWAGGGWHGGPPWARGGGEHHFGHGHGGDEGGFGVRRPLRFLAWKLELSEAQVGQLAAILDALKIERAQASVDQRRTTSSLADALEGGSFDAAKASAAATDRAKSTEKVQAAVVSALEKMHAVLDETQRQKLAYLLRTGQLAI